MVIDGGFIVFSVVVIAVLIFTSWLYTKIFGNDGGRYDC